MAHHNLSHLTLEVRQFEVGAFVCNGNNPDHLRLTDETIQVKMENSRFNLRKSIYLRNHEMTFPQVKILPVIMEAVYFKPIQATKVRGLQPKDKGKPCEFS